MIKFEPGKTYCCRAIGDVDCVWTFEVLSRTAKMMVLAENHPSNGAVNKIQKMKIHNKDNAVETAHPMGRHSLAPVLRASGCIEKQPLILADEKTRQKMTSRRRERVGV